MLTSLVLIDNPVSKKENYREYVIHKIPSLKVLDFKKIKPQVFLFNKLMLILFPGKKSSRSNIW